MTSIVHLLWLYEGLQQNFMFTKCRENHSFFVFHITSEAKTVVVFILYFLFWELTCLSNIKASFSANLVSREIYINRNGQTSY